MKKILKCLMVLLMGLSLAGCGSKETNNENPVVTIKVKDYGEMKFELYPDVTETTNNFIYLVNQGFYNGLTFHRLVKDFMIQGGDPQGDGTGGPGYSIKGEFNQNLIRNDYKHEFGSLAMARGSEYDSAGSQFYIVTGNASNLDGSYAVFGKIISGEDVLRKLNKASVDVTTELLTPPITIEEITVDLKGKEYPEPTRIS